MASNSDVKLFWKLALKEPCPLRQVVLPQLGNTLSAVPQLHITLLYYGGQKASKAADRLGVPLQEFQQVERELNQRAGEVVPVQVDSICIHRDVVFAKVVLPSGFPCLNADPFVKFRVSPMVSGSVVIELRQRNDRFNTIRLPQPLILYGAIALESGRSHRAPSPLHHQRPQLQQQQRLPREVQGYWVRVKKHSSMGCAVVTFPNMHVRDAVLQRCVRTELRGVPLDIKRHSEKTSGGQKSISFDAIFVAWRGRTVEISAQDLQFFFDRQAAQHLQPSPARLPFGVSEFKFNTAASEFIPAGMAPAPPRTGPPPPSLEKDVSSKSIDQHEESALESDEADVAVALLARTALLSKADAKESLHAAGGQLLSIASHGSQAEPEPVEVALLCPEEDGDEAPAPVSCVAQEILPGVGGQPLSIGNLEEKMHGESNDQHPESAEWVPFGSDETEVTVLRLTRMARSEEVISLLLNSPLLAKCHAQVKDAGCEIMPAWAHGAKLLVPLSAGYVQEVGLDLKSHHVVILSKDIELLHIALAELPYRRRAKVSGESFFSMPECFHSLASSVRTVCYAAESIKSSRESADAVEVIVECSLKTDSSVGYNSS